MGKEQELILAVRNSDLIFLNKVLQKGNRLSKTKHRSSSKRVNVNYQDGDGMSGLHQAALMGHTEIMELLLDNGAAVTIKDNKGMIPLHYAAWQGKSEPVHILLQWKSPANEQAQGGETPLHLACQHGHFDVVNLLLIHHASPITVNKDKKTPLDLACEFGRYRVVDLLLRSNLCSPLLSDNGSDMTESKTTCLHLAAKNGHQDIIRLLLQAGVNINRTTLQGTCLHEAALYGKTDVVRLLLDCGVDVNKTNSYDQTALDIVNKFTANRASKEIKQLLKEASFCVQAKAIKDHCNIYDPNTLTFKEGDLIKIVEQRQDGVWKGTLMKDGCTAKPGWFPADHVVLIDSNAGKRNSYQINSFLASSTPPQTPSSLPGRSCSFSFNGVHTPMSSRSSSYGSFGHDEDFPPPPSPTCMTKFEHVTNNKSDNLDGFPPPPEDINQSFEYFPPPPVLDEDGEFDIKYNRNVSQYLNGTIPPDAAEAIKFNGDPLPPPPPDILVSHWSCDLEGQADGMSKDLTSLPPPPPPSYNTVVNNIPNHQNLNGKVIVNHIGDHCYVDNLEPQYQNSWDMRSASPAGSNRNSAASSDSGRGLSANYLDPKVHHNYVNVQVSNHHRLSGTSYESGVSSRQSYHSTSSSSVGSLDRLEESGYSSQINVAELFQAGVPDHEVLRAWLSDLHYDEYYQNFVQAGYDMPTITHMTPQDLTAIGISKPGHRKKLKSEIGRLNLPDGIPDYKPNDIYDWLRVLNLEQYYNTLANQGYDNIDYVVDITWEDLEEIGIQRLGHQKKIMLAIERLKRILTDTKRLSTMDGKRDSVEVLEPPMASIRWSGERSSPPPPAPPQYNELPPYLKPRRSSSGDSLSTNSSGEMKSINQPLENEYANTSSMNPKSPSVVPIKVKRSLSQSTPNGMGDGRDSMGSPQKMCQSFHGPGDRTSDYSDRENTPTGDDMDQMSRSPVAITPVAPRVAAKPKPVATIVAKAKQSSREGSPDIVDIEKHEAERNTDGYKSPVKNLDGFKYPLATNGSLKRRQSDHIYDTPQLGPPRPANNYVNYPPMSMHQIPYSLGSPVHVSTHYDTGYSQAGSPRASLHNSPGGRAKKAPPPPPKRSHSIRTSTGDKIDTVPTSSVNNHPTSVLSPPPIQPKPQVSATPQAQAFVNCVQSLSERFGKKSEENSSCGNTSSDGEDLPPPPPPVAMDIITPKISNYGLLGKGDKPTSGEYMLQQRLKRENSSSASPGTNGVESAFGVKLRQVQNESQNQSEDTSENQSHQNGNLGSHSSQANNNHTQQTINAQNSVHQNSAQTQLTNESYTKEQSAQRSETEQPRKDSNGNLNLSASTSSLDSNSLPFANENVGTIKQRATPAKPSLVMIYDDGRRDSGDSDTVFNSEGQDTLKRTPNKFAKPQQPHVQHLQQQDLHKQLQQHQQSKTEQQQQQKQQQRNSSNTYSASVTATIVPGSPPQPASQAHTRPAIPQKPVKPAVSPKPTQRGKGGRSGDVLSEIDNMLQGLTDELDAMLDLEVTE